MTAKSYSRGHEIKFMNEKWVYSDNHEPINDYRKCKKCGERPTAEGHDKCLGTIEGVKSACCGHGVEDQTIMYEGGRIEIKKLHLLSDNQFMGIVVFLFCLSMVLLFTGIFIKIYWLSAIGGLIFVGMGVYGAPKDGAGPL